MFIKDNFIHSEYAKKTGFKGRIAILKSEVKFYQEHEDGSMELWLKDGTSPIISMPYEEVQKALQETVA